MMTLGVLVSLTIVLISTVVYVGLLWWADRYEKEPKRLFALALFWGAVPAILLALLGESRLNFGDATPEQRLVQMGIVGPVIEEAAKGFMMPLLLWLAFMEFDDTLDGAIYGALTGFGFAMTENFLYLVGALQEGLLVWTAVLVLRQFVFGLNHAFYTAFTGVGFGLYRGRLGRWRVLFPIGGWALAVTFHGLHNVTVSMAQHHAPAFLLALLFDAGGILVVLVVLVGSILRERRIMTEELATEVGNVISAEDYERVRRLQLPLIGLSAGERRRLRQVRQLAAELALKKYQQRVHGETREVRLRIQQLRAALVALRQEHESSTTNKEDHRHAR